MTSPMEAHLMEAFMSAAWLTDVGRVRDNNEDALIVADLSVRKIVNDSGEARLRRIGERGWLLAVADGVGGARAGEVASRIATERLAQILISAAKTTPVPVRLRDGLSSANQKIRRVSQERPECHGMGATMTAAVIHEGRAVIGQVGDSRGYLIRAGRIRQITKDHSLVQALIDAGVMTPEEATYSSRRNVILKALGAKDEIEPDLSLVALARGDHLLLCSDGLSDKVDDVEMRNIALRAEPLDAACARLVDLANERGGEDNITVILARFDGVGLPSPETSNGQRILVESL
jgi:protein phosphatase